MVPRNSKPPAFNRLQSNYSTKSAQSYSSAFEADDERSSSEFDTMTDTSTDPEMATHRRVKAEYPGEDTRLTSRKELAGWYAYGFAAEVFVICGMGMLTNFLYTVVMELLVVRGGCAVL